MDGDAADIQASCLMFQRLVTGPEQRTVLQVVIRLIGASGESPAPPSTPTNVPTAARLRLVLPLGLDLAAGVLLRIDGKDWTRMAVRTCLSSGCHAGLLLSEEDVERLEAGDRLGVFVQAMNGEVIGWPVSLSGFTASYAKMTSSQP